MDLTQILKTFFGSENNQTKNFDLSTLLGSFLSSQKSQTQPIFKPNFEDPMWQLPNYNFENNSSKFSQTQMQEKQDDTNFSLSPEIIAEIAKLLTDFLNKTKNKKEKEELNSSSFISSLKRCD